MLMLCGSRRHVPSVCRGRHRWFVMQIEVKAPVEAFLWEVVLVLELELGACEGVGLIWTLLAQGGAKGEGRVWDKQKAA